MRKQPSEYIRYLKIILGVFFALVVSYNFYLANNFKYEADGDASSFIGLGVGLAKHQKYGHLKVPGGGIIEAFREKKVSEKEFSFAGHSTWRPPVWPFLIAGVFLLAGYNLTYILIFKFLLHLLGTFIFYKSLKLLKIKEALVIIGTFLYGVSPAWQIYSRTFLSEPVTMFFITLWTFLVIRLIKNKNNFLPQAFVGGILALSHPYYIFLPFSIWLILYLRKRILLKHFLISSLICASVLSVWIIRNALVLKTDEIVVTTSSGAVMAKGWNKEVVQNHTNTKGDLADESLVLQDYEYDRTIGYNEVERMQLYKDASLNFIRTNPDLILPIIGKKLLSAFNPFPETPKPGILETGRALSHLLALLALFYLLIFSQNKLVWSFALGLVISTIAITILTYSGFRFRMPQAALELLLIISAAHELIRNWQERNVVEKQ